MINESISDRKAKLERMLSEASDTDADFARGLICMAVDIEREEIIERLRRTIEMKLATERPHLIRDATRLKTIVERIRARSEAV